MKTQAGVLRNALFIAAAVCFSAPVFPAFGGTVHGTVKNGTTGKAAAGVEVILIQLQGGMQPVQNSKTDAQGQFTFDFPAIGTQPMLVRAVYRGVNFHEPLPPGTSDIQVEVFDPSRDPKTVKVATHFVVFQPNGASLIVGEEYAIRNDSSPAQAYFREDGNFDFTLPEGATLKQVAAQGPSGMPVVQAPIERGKNRYSVAFAFRPGDNGVRFSYELPYPGNAATVKLPTSYPEARLVVVAPPTVQIAGEALQPGGQEQGMNVYDRGTLAANSSYAVNVSGTAPPPSANADADGAAQGRDAQQDAGSGSGVIIQTVPGRLDSLKWPLVGGFLAIFVILAILLARRPVVAVAGGPVVNANASAPETKRSKKPATTSVAATAERSAALADVDAAVGTSLDALKDTLFRLELRRQAGTISEDEYTRERARAEKVLRDLVRG
ncbi:MAG TPA: carboxypeptidase-like regulatory domain-containing protein [Candidatus Methylomirabilis sp.]|nr:carboxypeptidase-like regulatory domain-containing protein [Candidatus Methylomirabilis sp.]